MVKAKYVSDTEIKRASKAYDAIYDLNSWTSYEFDKLIIFMNKYYLRRGYVFKLNQRTQRFKLVRKK